MLYTGHTGKIINANHVPITVSNLARSYYIWANILSIIKAFIRAIGYCFIVLIFLIVICTFSSYYFRTDRRGTNHWFAASCYITWFVFRMLFCSCPRAVWLALCPVSFFIAISARMRYIVELFCIEIFYSVKANKYHSIRPSGLLLYIHVVWEWDPQK